MNIKDIEYILQNFIIYNLTFHFIDSSTIQTESTENQEERRKLLVIVIQNINSQ